MSENAVLERKGLVHLYCGDGKGKTTAAVGLCVRALGAGIPVLFCQFLKGRVTAEAAPLEKLGAAVMRAECCGKFVSQMTESELDELCRMHAEFLIKTRGLAESGRFGLVALDEVIDAVNCGAVALRELLALIENRPHGTELVLTGRDPKPELAELADYHTEFVCRRHPYECGTAARRGIEY